MKTFVRGLLTGLWVLGSWIIAGYLCNVICHALGMP